jgi:hypothetical protein
MLKYEYSDEHRLQRVKNLHLNQIPLRFISHNPAEKNMEAEILG